MGFWNKNKKSDNKRLGLISDELKDIANNNKDIAALYFYKNENGGSSFLQGDASSIHKMLLSTAKQDASFASILMMVSRDLNSNDLDSRMPDELKDILSGKKSSGLIDLPGGNKGIAIDPNNIDSLSDEDIDDIINNILKGNPNKD